VDRSSVFLTTKLGHADRIVERLNESVGKIDPRSDGYVDLFLIHAPSAGPEKRKEQWAALEDLVKNGKAKAIGVSN
jgi:diketogulonate reductase-like aldo/keto reductase